MFRPRSSTLTGMSAKRAEKLLKIDTLFNKNWLKSKKKEYYKPEPLKKQNHNIRGPMIPAIMKLRAMIKSKGKQKNNNYEKNFNSV